MYNLTSLYYILWSKNFITKVIRVFIETLIKKFIYSYRVIPYNINITYNIYSVECVFVLSA